MPHNRALEAIRNIKGNVTVVQSEKDESILPSVIAAYVISAQDSTHKLILGAQHSLQGHERAEFKALLIDWAAKL